MLEPLASSKDHLKGSLYAPVILVEYGDFECPYCGAAYPVIKRLEKEMQDQLGFVYRYFPLTEEHPHALHAAWAAEAAGNQNHFWQMHDLLYQNQDQLSDEDLEHYAKKLSLNMSTFTGDMFSDEVNQVVENDMESGLTSGVNGTPTFFINGYRYDGADDFDDLLTALRNEVRT